MDTFKHNKNIRKIEDEPNYVVSVNKVLGLISDAVTAWLAKGNTLTFHMVHLMEKNSPKQLF